MENVKNYKKIISLSLNQLMSIIIGHQLKLYNGNINVLLQN